MCQGAGKVKWHAFQACRTGPGKNQALAAPRRIGRLVRDHVSGHDFSRADSGRKDWALAPVAKPSRPSHPQDSKGQPRTFFLTTRTAGGRSLFQTDRMASLLIDVLRFYTLAGKFKVHDFVVMRNHLHLLVTVDGDMSVEKAMQLMKVIFHSVPRSRLGSQVKSGSEVSPMCGSQMRRAFLPIRSTSTTTRLGLDWRTFLRNTRIVQRI